MVEIRGIGRFPVTGTSRSGRTAGGEFRITETAAQRQPEATEAVNAAPGVMLLAVQEAGAAAERDRRAKRQALALLEELRALQAALLAGRLDPARLTRLAALCHGEIPADPALADIVAAIRLRASVELARLGLALDP